MLEQYGADINDIIFIVAQTERTYKMKYFTKIVILINVLTICIFLSACGEVLGESKKVESTAEYKLKKSMEIQNTEAAREAIAEGADVNMFHNKKCWDKVDKGQSESNPVRIAMFNGCYQVAEILLENGADANYEDSSGVSLLQAASNRNEQFIKVLIDHGAEIDKVCGNGKTALEYAIANCNWKAITVLLEYSPEVREKAVTELTDVRKNHPYDLWNGFDEIKALLHIPEFADCEVNKLFSVINPTDIAELYAAAAYGTPETVVVGLQKIPNCDIASLCECAARYGNTAVLKYIFDTYPNQETELYTKALCAAAEHDDVETSEFILNLSPDANLGKIAETAAKNNAVAIMKKLMDFGLNINETINGDSLLKAACFDGNTEMIQFLIEHGANVNGINNGEPLSVATRKGYIDIVRYLIDNGANVNGNNIFSDGSGGESVLMYAIKGGQLECVKILVEHGADITYEYNGENAIDVAKASPSERVYQYLCSVGG